VQFWLVLLSCVISLPLSFLCAGEVWALPFVAKKKAVRRGNAPCLAWFSESVQPRAVLLCVHGLGLHNGTYESFGKAMSERGFPCYAIDVRGFGSWMEAKGRQAVDFDGCLLDIQNTLKVVHRAHPGLPVFIVGESMGGAIALRATAMNPQLVQGLISSVPAADRFKQGRTSLRVALHFLQGPDKPINVGEGVIRQATEKPELREAWSKDPLARMRLSPKELIQFQFFMNQNHDCAKQIMDKPVLFVQGCKDKLVKPVGTEELFNNLSTKDREIQLIEKGEHLIFEENQFTQEVLDKLVTWLDAHLPAQKISNQVQH
jgi:alpha-beta hydrolase superfamily lysophospholipase